MEEVLQAILDNTRIGIFIGWLILLTLILSTLNNIAYFWRLKRRLEWIERKLDWTERKLDQTTTPTPGGTSKNDTEDV